LVAEYQRLPSDSYRDGGNLITVWIIEFVRYLCSPV
jgi:hypothetical protein